MTTVTMERGTSREVVIPVTDTAGNPLDLTNGSARFWIGKSVDSTGDDVVVRKDTGVGGGIVITESGGLFTLNVDLAPDDTKNLEPRDSYYYESEVTDQNSNVYVIVGGVFELKPSLTAPPAT